MQWGVSGLVLRDEAAGGSYGTAFFEAFPGNGGFLRGEGETLELAEADAFAVFSRENACPGHVWGRRGYLNGGAFCLRCKCFKVQFKTVYMMGGWSKPLTDTELSSLGCGVCIPRHDDKPEQRRYRRRLWLRGRVAGVDLPPQPPVGITEDEKDAFIAASDAAVLRWFAAAYAARGEPGEKSGGLMEEFFGRLASRDLERRARKEGLIPA